MMARTQTFAGIDSCCRTSDYSNGNAIGSSGEEVVRVEYDSDSYVASTDTYDRSITANTTNGATCSVEGIVFCDTGDYVDVAPWHFGEL